MAIDIISHTADRRSELRFSGKNFTHHLLEFSRTRIVYRMNAVILTVTPKGLQTGQEQED